MKRKCIALVGAGLVSLASLAYAANPPSSSPPGQSGQSSSGQISSDHQYIREQLGSCEYQIAAGKLAMSKSTDDSIKQYAQSQIDQATREMKQIQQLHESIRSGSGDSSSKSDSNQQAGKAGEQSKYMTSTQQAMLTDLSSKSGKDFDRCYSFQQVSLSQMGAMETAWQSQNAQNPQVKQFAQQQMASIQPVQQKAEQIASTFLPNGGRALWHGERSDSGTAGSPGTASHKDQQKDQK